MNLFGWLWPRGCAVWGHAMCRSIHSRDVPADDPRDRPIREVMWYCDTCGKVEWLNSLIGFEWVHRVDGQAPLGFAEPTNDERALIAESRAAWKRARMEADR